MSELQPAPDPSAHYYLAKDWLNLWVRNEAAQVAAPDPLTTVEVYLEEQLGAHEIEAIAVTSAARQSVDEALGSVTIAGIMHQRAEAVWQHDAWVQEARLQRSIRRRMVHVHDLPLAGPLRLKETLNFVIH